MQHTHRWSVLDLDDSQDKAVKGICCDQYKQVSSAAGQEPKTHTHLPDLKASLGMVK